MAPSGRTTPSTGSNRRDSLSSNPSQTANGTSVKVVLRIRPSSGQDHAANVPQRLQRTVVSPLNATTLQVDQAAAATQPGGNKHFIFDRVIGPSEGQAAVYEEAETLVESFLQGFNVTILAYGQTSSGKSYTMGTDRTSAEDDDVEEDRLGITPRAVRAIFDRMRDVQAATKGATSFSAKLSYVELYNEELIDLLAGGGDARPTVQVREDKAGNIVWSGLREVKVTSAADVMNNLTAGSALRQTNATDMNAQSSRSHAIFSLTLTQRKYTGSGHPSPPSPTPSGSRISRPSGLPTRNVTSPTPGSRSATPTGDRPGSRFGLRPPSVLGRAASPAPGDESGGIDQWLTLTSKFHFVDLAGSERLKRTSAQGERVKEGISINSGLHALGNVISALGDPTRARQTTHIPYRDSKLTRLLQDSLGGNAQTMMVACVSPTEFNLNETLSTLKYANRARNIKNRAEVNAVEVGWDDVEYLQRTILQLRGELGSVRSGEGAGGIGLGMGPIAEEGSRRSADGGSRELQDRYSDLTQKYAQLTAELATAKLATSSTSSSSLSRDEFAKAVEPIVEEYEKSLSALESQLSLTKAALGHSEDEMYELEARIEEDTRAAEAREALVGELKTRVVKLAEREATTEAYVRDLEAKLKDHADLDETHGSAVSDLRKELTRNREQAETTEQYVRELEARLARSDETAANLRRQIDVLERDIERREEAYHELEGRLSLLDTSGEHKLLLAEIDERGRRVLDLERSVDELRSQNFSAEQEAARLAKVAAAEKEAKEELQSRVRTLERASMAAPSSMAKQHPQSFTPPQTPAEGASSRDDPLAEASSAALDPAVVANLQSRIEKLQASYEDTLADLEAANLKYRNSLKEIEDLNSQVEEAKLHHNSDSDVVPSPVSTTFTQHGDDSSDETEVLSDAPTTITAATLSTSPPNRTPRSRRSMPLAPQHRLSFLGRGQGAPAQSHLRSASLSQELSLAQGLHLSSPPSPRAVSPNHRESRDMFSSAPTDRTYEQMKNEVMKLQQVLREREEEISSLEASLVQLHGSSGSSSGLTRESGSPPRIVTTGAFATPPRGTSPDVTLSPKTVAAFEALKADLNLDDGADYPIDAASSHRLDEIMRSMAKKESGHREVIERLEDQLVTIKRQHEELTILSRDQVVNMASEIETLRALLEGRPEAAHYEGQLKAMEDVLAAKDAELHDTREKAALDLSTTTSKLTEEHERAIASTSAVHAALLLQVKEEHADILRRHLTEREELLAQKESEHAAALHSQADEHSEVLRLRSLDHDNALQAKSEEMAGALKRKADELEELTRRHEIERTAVVDSGNEIGATVDQLNSEHAAVLQKREADFASAREKLVSDHGDALVSRDASHAAALTSVREEHDKAIGEAIVGHSEALGRLRDEHESRTSLLKVEQAAVVAALVAEHAASLSTAATDFDTRSKELQDSHDAQVESLRAEHAEVLAAQSSSHAAELAALSDRHAAEMDAKVATLSEEHSQAVAALSTEHDISLQSLSDSHAEKLSSLAGEHEKVVQELQAAHDSVLAAKEGAYASAISEASQLSSGNSDAKLKALEDDHNSAVSVILEQHATVVSAVATAHESNIISIQAEHAQALEHQRTVHASALEDLNASHAQTLAEREKERDDARGAYLELAGRHKILGTEHAAVQKSLATTKADQEALLDQFGTVTEDHDVVVEKHLAEIASLTASLAAVSSTQDARHAATAKELQDSLDALSTLEKALGESRQERERLLEQVESLGGSGSANAIAATKELDELKTTVGKLEAELARTKTERDAFQSEVTRLAHSNSRMSTSPNAASGSLDVFGFDSPTPDRAMSPTSEGRITPPGRHDSRLGVSGSNLQNGKPPPPTPPPSMPPPPLPTALPGLPNGRQARSSSSSSMTNGFSNSRSSGSIESTAGTSIRPGSSTATDSTTIDPRVAKKFEEQEAQIARLTKQLTHCESDLQANIDLVNTLESALNDSERNLRKARTQMNDLARERDSFLQQNDILRTQIAEATTENESVRNSVLQVESRWQEERRGKEAAKAELERRLDDVNKNNRKSKFACF